MDMRDKMIFKAGFWRFLSIIALFMPLISYGQTGKGDMEERHYIVCNNRLKFLDKENAEHLSDLKYYLKLRFPLHETDPKRFLVSMSNYLHKTAMEMQKPKWIKKIVLNGTRLFTRYDSIKALQGVTAMENYLYNQGYLRAKVRMESKEEEGCIDLIYLIELGPRYKLNNVKYEVLDSNLLPYQWDIQHHSLLKRGAPATDELFYKERARIVRQINNRGFAFFNASFIRPQPADTFSNWVNLIIDIVPPAPDSMHHKFRIGKVDVYPDYELARRNWRDSTGGGVSFHYHPGRIYIEPDVLSKKIKLYPGKTYTFDEEVKTFEGLNRLSAYRLVTMGKQIDADTSNLLNYYIRMSPAKKYEREITVGLTYSRFTGQQFFGNIKNIFRPNLEFSLKNRNFRKRGIGMHYYLSGDAEMYFKRSQETNKLRLAVNSYTFETGLSATLPNYTSFPGTFSLLYRSQMISPWFYNEIKQRAKPEFRMSFGLLRQPSFYSSIGAKVDFGYRFQSSEEANFTIRTLGLDYYAPRKGEDFEKIIGNNEFLLRSILGQRLFTSVFFKYFDYSFERKFGGRGFSWGSDGFLEQSGLELFLMNTLLSGISPQAPDLTILHIGRDTLQFSSFLRFGADFKAYYHFSREVYLAFRLGPAIAVPFGGQVVPYVKQYFVGGPNSIRAWDIRSLGPGRANLYKDSLVAYYSGGDFKLDINMELRFPTNIISSLKGAVFIDAANVWELRSDDPEKRLSKAFYQELAVGTGLGLRLDLEWFVIRGDMGVKLLYPYKVDGSRWVFNKNHPISNVNLRRAITWNIAIGYPF